MLILHWYIHIPDNCWLSLVVKMSDTDSDIESNISITTTTLGNIVNQIIDIESDIDPDTESNVSITTTTLGNIVEQIIDTESLSDPDDYLPATGLNPNAKEFIPDIQACSPNTEECHKGVFTPAGYSTSFPILNKQHIGGYIGLPLQELFRVLIRNNPHAFTELAELFPPDVLIAHSGGLLIRDALEHKIENCFLPGYLFGVPDTFFRCDVLALVELVFKIRDKGKPIMRRLPSYIANLILRTRKPPIQGNHRHRINAFCHQYNIAFTA